MNKLDALEMECKAAASVAIDRSDAVKRGHAIGREVAREWRNAPRDQRHYPLDRLLVALNSSQFELLSEVIAAARESYKLHIDTG